MKLIGLFFLSLIYSFITSLRNLFYDFQLLPIKKVNVPVISVGNLTVGGTGKTPMVKYLSKKLMGHGKKVAVVTRGYGGSYQGHAQVVDVNQSERAKLFGDEPVELAQSGIATFVGKKRIHACQLAMDHISPQIIICDDGFQHRSLHRDINILLLDATQDVAKYKVLPWGVLRERFSNFRRATHLFVTKVNLISPEQRVILLSFLSSRGFDGKKIFFYDYIVSHFLNSNDESVSFDQISNDKVALMCAIAKPEAFVKSLGLNVKNIVFCESTRDHHFWTHHELEKIINKCEKTGARFLITTEKDYVKINHSINRLKKSVTVLRAVLEVKATEDDNALFNAFI